MLATGTVLGPNEDVRLEEDILEQLRDSRFWPCLSPQLEKYYCDCKDVFYIADHPEYRAMFEGKISVLDFSYEELTSLHTLFRLLGIQDRYLSSHVESVTEEVDPRINEALTTRLRQCAYAISW